MDFSLSRLNSLVHCDTAKGGKEFMSSSMSFALGGLLMQSGYPADLSIQSRAAVGI